MRLFVTGVALVAGLALAVPAMASPGQCSMTGFGDFQCEVNVDGGGLTFALPDGQSLVFAHVADGEGLGYLIPAQSEPGQRPKELGMFAPVEGQAGCWFGPKDEISFCVAIEQ